MYSKFEELSKMSELEAQEQLSRCTNSELIDIIVSLVHLLNLYILKAEE